MAEVSCCAAQALPLLPAESGHDNPHFEACIMTSMLGLQQGLKPLQHCCVLARELYYCNAVGWRLMVHLCISLVLLIEAVGEELLAIGHAKAVLSLLVQSAPRAECGHACRACKD